VEVFNERAADHTGMPPLAVRTIDEAEAEWDDDVEDQVPDIPDSAFVSVVSRWDLAVHDSSALLTAGREAHRRMFEQEGAGRAGGRAEPWARPLRGGAL